MAARTKKKKPTGAELNFTEAEKIRFRNLLELAANSEYEGEKQNALQAAERLARRYGLSLDEAATLGEQEEASVDHRDAFRRTYGKWADQHENPDAFTTVSETEMQRQKLRRDAAMEAARKRGLDAAEEKAAQRRKSQNFRRKAGPKRDPHSHAEALLAETTIPVAEIAGITGLSVYEVMGMKLKMRRAG